MNSLSILTYLAVAEHVTGDPKYAAASRLLIDQHGYAHNAMYPKVQHGPGSGNQSDDEMAFMCYYGLLRYSKDEPLKKLIRYSFYRYWANEFPEMNPFFNFAYAAQASDQMMRNPWGEFPVAPLGAWHAESMATLRGFPLDRLNWPHQNSHRLDLVSLGGVQSRDAGTDLARAAAALAPVLRAHRQASNAMALPGSLDEIAVVNGSVCHLLRPLQRRPNQFLFARIDRSHANLALLKFKLAEAERNLG